jgi:hypothetical protein
MSEDMSLWTKVTIGIGGGLIITGCIAAFISISKFVGSKDKHLQIQEESSSIWTYSLLGSLLLFISACFYFIMGDNHEKIMYFIFAMTFLALGLSYSALSIALIHKN